MVGAADGNQAISMAEALQSDIVLLAVNIQELSALNALSLIRKKSPRTNVLILSGCPDDELMSAALQLGPKGMCRKCSVIRIS